MGFPKTIKNVKKNLGMVELSFLIISQIKDNRIREVIGLIPLNKKFVHATEENICNVLHFY